MAESTQIILDPTAHQHRTGRVWQSYQRECLRRLAPVEVSIVESMEQAEQAARISAMKGFRKIVAVGGGEAANGVINGLMGLAQSHRKSIGVGFLSVVRPDEWSRTLDLPRKVKRQVEVLQAGHTIPVDVGRVDCFSVAGMATTRYFLNGAGFGLPSRIRHELRGNRREFLETVAGIGGALRDFIHNQGPVVRIEGESGVLYEGPCPLGLAMGGRYYPALGEVAPQASPTDGALDAVWFGSPSRIEMLSRLAALLPGARRGAPTSGHARSRFFKVTAPDAPVYVEADGRMVGKLPATFSVEPRAIEVIVPQVGVKLKKPKFAPLPKRGEGNLAGNLKIPAGF